ncbi:hypothetical protein PG997_007152 [Apiospora hydei]|uniref:Uncharacterized protein n=1 Tax=Apiospora hydei TaxID=1337664 RepID=A0ABR1WS35_9PEZI
MNFGPNKIRSVAVIGAGASGIITAAALKAEDCFERIVVFERRDTPGGTWNYDANPQPSLPIRPGLLPPAVDKPLEIPDSLPRETTHDTRERYFKTPIYDALTHVLLGCALRLRAFSAALGASAVPGDVLCAAPARSPACRQHHGRRPVPGVFGRSIGEVEAHPSQYPGRVVHSKYFRSASVYRSKKVLVIGNSASGHDITNEVATVARAPVYQSRRHKNRWDGDAPPVGIAWKPVITEYRPENGQILFADGSCLDDDDVDTVIYCTGYRPSFPFWNAAANGRELYDYNDNKLVGNYWHTFFPDYPNLAVVGMPRTLTFRSFEYQAVAIARLWAVRASTPLPTSHEQRRWEKERLEAVRREGTGFHDVGRQGEHGGDMLEYFRKLYEIAGLGTLRGKGRVPPVLSDEVMWALDHLMKYPTPGKGKDGDKAASADAGDEGWVVVDRAEKDWLVTLS